MSATEATSGVAVPEQPWWRRVWNLRDYWLTVYRRTWKGSVVNSFVTPLLYVAAMGMLLGSYVQADPATLDGAPSYLAFVVPGMLAAQTMMMAFGESTYPVMGQIKWHKTYFSMLATPLGVPEIVLANLGFVVARVALASAVFVAVMVPFGVLASPWGALGAIAVQLVAGVAFAGPIYAFAASSDNEQGFTVIFRVLLLPLFLFSGGFFPVSNLGPALETAAAFTPLFHATELTRSLMIGTTETGPALVHLAYLAALAAVGVALSIRALQRRLVR